MNSLSDFAYAISESDHQRSRIVRDDREAGHAFSVRKDLIQIN